MNKYQILFPGFSLSNSDFRKVTKSDATHIAAMVPWINLILLTEYDIKNDYAEGLRFLDTEIYFETEDGCIWRIYKEKFQSQFVWALDSTKSQFEKYHFNPGEVSQFKVETNKEFAYDKFRVKVTKIVLVLPGQIKEKNAFQESDLVAKFNLAKGI